MLHFVFKKKLYKDLHFLKVTSKLKKHNFLRKGNFLKKAVIDISRGRTSLITSDNF